MSDEQKSTISALLKEKPGRGRPRHDVSRESVYVELSDSHKNKMKLMGKEMPAIFGKADIPDIATFILATRLESLRRSVADRDRQMPEGIMDIDSLYLLWDLPLPPKKEIYKWTSVRLSPQQAEQLGRVHGGLKARFGVSRSQVFILGLALCEQFINHGHMKTFTEGNLTALKFMIERIYL
jgi:hypothetical protein